MAGHEGDGGRAGGDGAEVGAAQPPTCGELQPTRVGANWAHRKRVVLLAVCALGISSIMTQLALMRELLCIFSGNELVFGIVLGNWLLLTGLGAYLGKGAARLRRPVAILVLAQILVATLPLVDVCLARLLRNLVFLPGAQVGVVGTALSSGLLLLPYCLIAGYLLTFACCLLASRQEATSIGQVYFTDNLGDIAGGAIFSAAVVYLSNHFHLLYFPAALNLLAAVAVAAAFRHSQALVAASVATVAVAITLLSTDLDDFSLRRQYAGERIVLHEQSPYGQLVVTESFGQYNFIENGVPLFSTHAPEQAEETAHYALAQRPDAKRVLLISGGVAGTAQQVLKWGVEAVDYVELDPLIVTAARRYVPQHLNDPRIRVVSGDGRRFVRRTEQRYDVVIADLPDPSTSQLNRFYTQEFFNEVSRILTPQGVLALSLAHYENYVSDQLAALLSVAERTLRSVFSNTRIVPGSQVYFLASNGPLSADIASRLQARNVQTQLLKPSYLSSILSEDRVADVRGALASDAPVNEDFSPVLYYRQLVYWTSQFRPRLGLAAALAALLLAAYLLRSGLVPFALFTAGCAASALQVVLLLAFQVVHGYVYQRVGLLVTLFIVGLAVGSLWMTHTLPRRGRRDLVLLLVGVAVCSGLLPWALPPLASLASQGQVASALSSDLAFPALALVPGTLVGMAFPLAAKVDFRGVGATASRLYAADFLGAWVGAMVIGALLIPVLGVTPVCLLVAGLNLASGCSMWLAAKA